MGTPGNEGIMIAGITIATTAQALTSKPSGYNERGSQILQPYIALLYSENKLVK